MIKTILPPPPPPNERTPEEPLGAEPTFDALEEWAREIRIREDHRTAENAADAYHHRTRQAGIKAFLS
jgi:hypothetical protein